MFSTCSSSKYKQKVATVILFLFLFCLTDAQEKSYTIESITYADGQRVDYTRDMVQDTTGILWFTGSFNGLLSYDGNKITSYNDRSKDLYVPFSRVVQLQSLPNGNLLLSPQNNVLYEFNPYTKYFVDSTVIDPALHVAIYDFDIDKNGIFWAVSFAFQNGSDYYLYRIEPDGETQFVDTISSKTWAQLMYYEEHVYCVATNSIQRYNLDGSHNMDFALRDGQLTVVPFRFAVDTENQLWIKSTSIDHQTIRSNAIYKFNKAKNEFNKVELPIPTALANTEYISFIGDELWLGGYYENLWCYNLRTQSIEDYSQDIRKGQSGRSYILGVSESSDGSKWVMTSAGIYKCTPTSRNKTRHILDVMSGFCDDDCFVHSIAASNSHIYFANVDQITAKNKSTNEIFKLPVSIANTRTEKGLPIYWSVGGQILSFASGKIFHHDMVVDASTFEHKHLIKNKQDFRVVNGFIDTNTVWFLPFNPQNLQQQLFEYKIKEDRIRPILLDVDLKTKQSGYQILASQEHDRVWLITSKGGLFEFDKNGKLLRHPSIMSEIGMTANHTYCLFEQEDVLWIGTYGGLIKYDWQDSFTQYFANSIKQFNREKRIGTHAMFAVDEQGLYLSGTQGLHYFDIESGTFRIPNQLQNERDNRFSHTAVRYEAEDHKLYFGSKNGVVSFHPSSTSISDQLNQSYPIRISQYSIFHKAKNKKFTYVHNLQDLKQIELSGTDLWFSLEYVIPNYSDESILYHHKLVGLESEYSSPSTFNEVKYTNLPHGTYKLMLRAQIGESTTTFYEKSILIEVGQLWYKSTWFLILCVMAAMLMAYAIARYRYYQKLKEQERIDNLRNRISRDLHDDVGSILTGLSMQSDILNRTAEEKHRPRIAKLNAMSREALSRIRDAVWTMNNAKDNWKSLIDRMHEFCQETLALKGIEYSIEHSQIILSNNLDSDIRQNTYLIFKEAVTNIVKHSNGSIMESTLQVKNEKIYFTIRDNGKIKNQNFASTGEGLANMQKRAEQMNAKIDISSRNGYRINLIIPFN